jgi:hypothetical protein
MKLTNQEKRERRREAARKGALTRKMNAARSASLDRVADLAVNGPDGRMLIPLAQSLGREADLWHHAHLGRYPTRPSAWTGAQRTEVEAFLKTFIRPAGTPPPVR